MNIDFTTNEIPSVKKLEIGKITLSFLTEYSFHITVFYNISLRDDRNFSQFG